MLILAPEDLLQLFDMPEARVPRRLYPPLG